MGDVFIASPFNSKTSAYDRIRPWELQTCNENRKGTALRKTWTHLPHPLSNVKTINVIGLFHVSEGLEPKLYFEIKLRIRHRTFQSGLDPHSFCTDTLVGNLLQNRSCGCVTQMSAKRIVLRAAIYFHFKRIGSNLEGDSCAHLLL